MKKFVILLGVLTVIVAQKDPHWRNDRNSIVHLFEWKFSDIADECERFLQHRGYAGVQVSPVSENIIVNNRPWWERYQPISYKIISRSGNEDDFLNMTTRCNAVGIRIYVDVVINHMTGDAQNAKGTGGSSAEPSKKLYPGVPYGPNDFHYSCPINNYNDERNVRYCELVGLKDLDQSSNYVRSKIGDYMNKLISLGVAGFRVDACKHMWPSDLDAIYKSLNNLNVTFGFTAGSRAFIYQEVIDLGGEAISSKEYTRMGAVTEFKFSTNIGRVFRGNDKLTYLNNWGSGWGFLPNSSDALVFVDNHDNQRGQENQILTYKNAKQYKMAVAFMLAHPYGVSRVMSSFAFINFDAGPPADSNGNIISPDIRNDDTCSNGWICEHRWRQIYNMIGFKNAVKGTGVNDWWSNEDQQIAFCRGNKGFVAFTNYESITRTLQTRLPPGNYCDVISGNLVKGKCTGKIVQVENDGTAFVELFNQNEDGVLAIHVNARLSSKP